MCNLGEQSHQAIPFLSLPWITGCIPRSIKSRNDGIFLCSLTIEIVFKIIIAIIKTPAAIKDTFRIRTVSMIRNPPVMTDDIKQNWLGIVYYSYY